MKLNIKAFLLAGGLFFTAALPARSALIAAWDFDGSVVAAPATPAIFAATVGAGSLNASAFSSTTPNPERTMFGGTSLNAFAGGDAGTIAALALANLSANGKSIIFSLDMSLYQNLVLSFATRGTPTGFNSQQWAYSTDGIGYTAFGANTADNSALFVLKSVDFSSITALNGDNSIFIKLTVAGATAAAGNNRFDNIQFSADPIAAVVPEPSTFIAGALLALPFGVHGIRYLRSRKQA